MNIATLRIRRVSHNFGVMGIGLVKAVKTINEDGSSFIRFYYKSSDYLGKQEFDAVHHRDLERVHGSFIASRTHRRNILRSQRERA